jgi:hypothetical protein
VSRDFRVIALIAAYNEADILGRVIEHLIEQGVMVYLLDDGSTDGTIAAAEPFLNRGLMAIEQLPGRIVDGRRLFEWKKILERKQELGHELDADWFIHHDADEFRESPWLGVSLANGIRLVDRLGYNAVDFTLLNFVPTGSTFQPGDDPRTAFRHYEPGKAFDRSQVKCWKKQADPVDLVHVGGHDVSFAGRRVFPLRFLLRHYPIRDQEHGSRKVFTERLPRFAADERAVGWHVQYDELTPGGRFERDPATLTEFDPVEARVVMAIDNRRVEDLETEVSNYQERVLCLERELHTRSGEIARLTVQVDALVGESQRKAEEFRAVQARFEMTVQQQRQQIDSVRNQVASLYASRSWRWTAPLRALYRLLGRVGQ